MPRFLYPERMKRLRLKAHEQGARHKETRGSSRKGLLPVALHATEWNAAGNCQRPVTVTLRSRPELRKEYWNVIRPGITGVSTSADIEVRCRKCPACLKARAAHWRYRALAEWRSAPRTWQVTLTFTPEEHYRAWALASRDLNAQGVDAEALDNDAAFAARDRILGASVQKWFKRLRKAGHAFRYLWVTEAHMSGLPHYHVLMHEAHAPIAHSRLKAGWYSEQSGHFHAKLVSDTRGATYSCKYLTKSALARVRASERYGALGEYVLGHNPDDPNAQSIREGESEKGVENESPPNEKEK